MVLKQKAIQSPTKPLNNKKNTYFIKKNSCPNLLTINNNLNKSNKSSKNISFLKKNQNKLRSSHKKLINQSNIEKKLNLHIKPNNKTFDFPSKDEEIIYNIINQEYQTLFPLSKKSAKLTKKGFFPKIDEYLIKIKNFKNEKILQKTRKIQYKCTEISKKLGQNLILLKLNFEQKKKQETDLLQEAAIRKIQHSWRLHHIKRQEKEKTLKNVLNICHTSLYQKNREKILQKKIAHFNEKTLIFDKTLKPKKRVLEVKGKRSVDLPKKLKLDSRKLKIFSKNPDSISSSKLRHSINTTLNFKEINENSKSLITIHDFNSRSIDRDELSKPSIHEGVLSYNNSGNIKKNTDFIRYQVEDHKTHIDLNKNTEFIKYLKNPQETLSYERIKEEENSENPSENEVFQTNQLENVAFKTNHIETGRKRTISDKIVNLMELSNKYQKEMMIMNEKYIETLNNKEINQTAEKFFALIKKQSELNKKILIENFKLNKAIYPEKNIEFVMNSDENSKDLIENQILEKNDKIIKKENFHKIHKNSDFSEPPKFFAKKQKNKNLVENEKINKNREIEKNLSKSEKTSKHEKSSKNEKNSKIPKNHKNNEFSENQKIDLKTNIGELRAAFGSEKLLKEASSSMNLRANSLNSENHKIFEEDSFRKFTNRKIMEFLNKENLDEMLKIRDRAENKGKKKQKSLQNLDSSGSKGKKGFEIEKWVSQEKNKLKILSRKREIIENLGCEMPKVLIFTPNSYLYK